MASASAKTCKISQDFSFGHKTIILLLLLLLLFISYAAEYVGRAE